MQLLFTATHLHNVLHEFRFFYSILPGSRTVEWVRGMKVRGIQKWCEQGHSRGSGQITEPETYRGHRNKRPSVLVQEISGLLCRDVMIFST